MQTTIICLIKNFITSAQEKRVKNPNFTPYIAISARKELVGLPL
jgi:hypothetical protein